MIMKQDVMIHPFNANKTAPVDRARGSMALFLGWVKGGRRGPEQGTKNCYYKGGKGS
jgi:hypothetical protein